MIRDNIALAEAPSSGLDIFRYQKSSPGAQDYSDLCDEIIERFRQLLGNISNTGNTSNISNIGNIIALK